MTLHPQSGDIPSAPTSTLTEPFWEGCRRGELLYQYFPDVNQAQFNPAPISRSSLSPTFVWRASSGLGTIYSWTVVWRPQTGNFDVPYAPAIIDMAEGYQMVSNIIGCEPSEIAIDAPVRVVFHTVRPGFVLPYFTLVAG